MTETDFSVEKDGTAANVRVTGELDVYSSPQLHRMLDDLLANEVKQIDLDLSAVPFFDSSAITVVMLTYKKAINSGGGLKIVGASSQVRRVLTITGLDSFMV